MKDKDIHLTAQRRLLMCFLLCLLSARFVYGQEVSLRLEVLDIKSQKGISDAYIHFGTLKSQITDESGIVECIVPQGEYKIKIHHLSYETGEYVLKITGDTLFRCFLESMPHTLEEAHASSFAPQKGITGILGGRIDLNMESLSILPKFMGSNDPMKILQLTPGVQTANEGEAGMFIRGGENGHNLILWNEAPIYNASHLLGSFSIFNTGHIGKFRLLKSNINASYGGRLSSIITVDSPEKIPEKLSVSGSVGIIASQGTLAIPLHKKHALYLSGRKTYVGLVLKPLLGSTMKGKGSDTPYDYEFQDVNITFISNPTKQDRIIVNGYWGLDCLEVGEPEYAIEGNMKWSNLAISTQWKRTFKEKGNMKHSIFVSRYTNDVDMFQSDLSFRLPSSIFDIGYRPRFEIRLGNHILTIGGDYTRHKTHPQVPTIRFDSIKNGGNSNSVFHTHEFGGFLSGTFHLVPHLWTEIGIRYSANLQNGEYNDLQYSSQGILIDSVHYEKGKRVNLQQGWEPRIAINYSLSTGGLLQVSYNRLYQYMNLVSISGVGLPTDFWIPSSLHTPAQRTDNFSIGYFQALSQNVLEFSMEGYYRTLKNQLEYDNGLIDLLNQKYILEQSLLLGKGYAYGGEWMIKYNGKRLNGWVSYTLGWSKRRFPDIEEGRIFPAKHDRRHDLSIVTSYELNKRWDFSAAFIYGTGNAYTQPIGMSMVGGNPVKEYGPYNGARLPNYHRLDISANYWFSKRVNRENGLNFSVYNIYRRKNPLYIFVIAKKNGNNQIVIQKKYKRIYDIVPSISWTFKF